MRKHIIRNTTLTTAMLTLLAMGAAAQQDHSHGDDAAHSHGGDEQAHQAPSETETFFGSDAADADAGQTGEAMHEHAEEHGHGDGAEHSHNDEGHGHAHENEEHVHD